MNIKSSYTIFPLGDSALLINFGNEISEEVNDKVLLAYHVIKNDSPAGITDVVPSYSSVTVHYDIIKVLAIKRNQNTAYESLASAIHVMLDAEYELLPYSPRLIEVPVCYSVRYGPDLKCIARFKHLTIEEVIQLHTARFYRVYMIGFMPGFTYMAEVDERIQVRRRSEPRTLVESGSVGIAGRQTGIYPVASPGGWQLIGRTPWSLFNKDQKHPVLFQPGDKIRFYSITEDEFEDYKNRHSG